jgi:hypothetical protein
MGSMTGLPLPLVRSNPQTPSSAARRVARARSRRVTRDRPEPPRSRHRAVRSRRACTSGRSRIFVTRAKPLPNQENVKSGRSDLRRAPPRPLLDTITDQARAGAPLAIQTPSRWCAWCGKAVTMTDRRWVVVSHESCRLRPRAYLTGLGKNDEPSSRPSASVGRSPERMAESRSVYCVSRKPGPDGSSCTWIGAVRSKPSATSFPFSACTGASCR